MFIVGNFLDAIATVADVLLNALLIIVLINAVLSWVRPDPSNPIVAFLERVSDAVCNPIRRMFPTTGVRRVSLARSSEVTITQHAPSVSMQQS